MVRAKMVFMSDKLEGVAFESRQEAWAAEFKQRTGKSVDADHLGEFYTAVQRFESTRSKYLCKLQAAKQAYNMTVATVRNEYDALLTKQFNAIEATMQNDECDAGCKAKPVAAVKAKRKSGVR